MARCGGTWCPPSRCVLVRYLIAVDNLNLHSCVYGLAFGEKYKVFTTSRAVQGLLWSLISYD